MATAGVDGEEAGRVRMMDELQLEEMQKYIFRAPEDKLQVLRLRLMRGLSSKCGGTAEMKTTTGLSTTPSFVLFFPPRT